MKPAILYLRYSPRPKRKRTKGNGEQELVACESCELQLEHCKRWCEAHGYEVIGEPYRDEAKSGANMRRDGLNRAIARILDAPGITLVVYSLSRLSRNTEQALAIARRIAKAGGFIASTCESVDINTPEGRMTFSIQCTVNQYNREMSANATAHAMQRRVRNGQRTGGRPPFGKRSNEDDPGGDYVDDLDELATLDLAMRLYTKGEGVSVICRILDRKGMLCRGKQWKPGTLRRIILREAGKVAS